MKRYLLFTLSCFLFLSAEAQTKNEKKLNAAVEQLRKAMVEGDKNLLDKLTDEKLSYGHSGGHVDDKKQFVDKLASGKSDFLSIELLEQSISISKKTAIVRHKLNAQTNDGGKPGEVHLLVMLVWQKKAGSWKLLARQAVKLTN